MSNMADEDGYRDWQSERPDPDPPEAIDPDDFIGTITKDYGDPPF